MSTSSGKRKTGYTVRIEWSDDLSTGVDIIDSQHKELIKRINMLVEAMDKGRGREEVSRMVGFLGSYITKHFNMEERLMRRYGYPERNAHVDAHNEFIDDYKAFKDRIEGKGASSALATSTHRWLRSWLIDHISMTDRLFGGFLNVKAAG